MSAPGVFENSLNANPAFDVTVEHLADQVDTVLAHNVRDTQVVIHDFVNRVERVLFVDNRVEKDAQSPDVLLFAAIWRPAKDLGGGIVWSTSVSSGRKTESIETTTHTNGTNKDIKGSRLDVRSTSKIDKLDSTFAIENHVFVLDVAMNDSGFVVQMVNGTGNLDEDLPTFLLFHIDSELNVVKQVHAR